MARPYAVIDSRTVSTAITVLELTAPSTAILEVMRVWCTQSSVTTSSQTDIAIVRKTATITGTSITPVKLQTGSASASFTAKRTATAEGTDGDLLYGEGFNILNGFFYVPVPEERIMVPPSGIVALKFQSAPVSATYRYGMIIREIG